MLDLKFYLFHSHPGIVEQVAATLLDLDRQEYRLLDPSEVMTCIRGDHPDGRYAVLTFDDGREEKHTDILDFLRERGIRAIAFLFPLEHTMDSLRLSWDFWRRNTDVIEIGAHSLTHSRVAQAKGPDVTGPERLLSYRDRRSGADLAPGLVARGYDQLYDRPETDGEYRMRLESEIYLAKKMLERSLGVPCRFFSYPWGLFTPEVVEIVKESGFEAAFSVNQTDGTVWSIPRIDMDSDQPKRSTRTFSIGGCRVLQDCA
ncbi:MAG TPA: polysaccharide deacetylase family protein [Thermoanaerobaculia bacterium]|nr:polysaccharide deacetylase family protein [Thermoanaerobaculia bacterium]